MSKFSGIRPGAFLLRREHLQDRYRGNFQAGCRSWALPSSTTHIPTAWTLCDVHLRQAKELGAKIVISTDSHDTANLDNMRFGVLQLRRAGLTKEDVLNTLPVDEFLRALRKAK